MLPLPQQPSLPGCAALHAFLPLVCCRNATASSRWEGCGLPGPLQVADPRAGVPRHPATDVGRAEGLGGGGGHESWTEDVASPGL